uniref:Uncharacterized protein n=1 Tax=Desulfovibrio sp. U5L TaxID=596152 RepID=I2Q569_9BACT
MGKSLENRVARLMERLGDPDDLRTRVRAMTDEELRARLRELMVQGGYDPGLPHAEALAAYVAKLKAEAATLSGEDQALTLRLAGLVRGQADSLPELFPESPRQPQEAQHV